MLTAAAILLFLLPLQVNALLTADAKCLPGYDWMFSSIHQSPCDVAAELASVCIARSARVDPLPVGYVYAPPTSENQNNCRCSSVYYSLLSGCAYCQDRNYRRWSIYKANCSNPYLTVYPEELPAGVRVPAYAYQDVSISDRFDATVANSTRGIESSRLPSSTAVAAASGGNGTTAIVGGVVGGLVGLGLIVAVITFLVLRSKRKSRSSYLQSFNMVHTPDTASSLIQSATSPPGIVYNPNGKSTYSFPGPMYDYRQHSLPIIQNATPNLNATPNFTENSAQNRALPPVPQNIGSRYSGMPEL